MARSQNKSRYAILGILLLGPRSGYDIKKFFERTIGNFWNESYGQIYPILRRLAADKLVEKSIEKQVGKPDRHVYTITTAGQNEMRQWLQRPVSRHIGRHEILLKLILGCRQKVTDNIRQIEHFSDMQRQDLAQTTQLRAMVEEEYRDDPAMPYLRLALDYGHRVNRAYLDWAEEAVATLKALSTDRKPDEAD